jgi:hypothetical protein
MDEHPEAAHMLPAAKAEITRRETVWCMFMLVFLLS